MKNNNIFFSFLIMVVISFISLISKLFFIQIFALEFEICIFYFPTLALFLAFLFSKKRKG